MSRFSNSAGGDPARTAAATADGEAYTLQDLFQVDLEELRRTSLGVLEGSQSQLVNGFTNNIASGNRSFGNAVGAGVARTASARSSGESLTFGDSSQMGFDDAQAATWGEAAGTQSQLINGFTNNRGNFV
jgi:hypothetical protein